MHRLVSADIEAYAQAHSMPESDLCRALREETQRRMKSPQMIVGLLEEAFLTMMAHRRRQLVCWRSLCPRLQRALICRGGSGRWNRDQLQGR
jgi:hypothetical protein